MANLFGRPMSEVLGRTARDMFGEEYSRSIRAYDEQVLASGRAISVEEHLPGADRYEWTLVMRFPVRTSPDAPLRVGGFDIDITSQKRAEAEPERSREALYQSEKLTALGSLLAGVSHELNNPLSIIVAQATLLEHEAEGTPHAARSAKIRNLGGSVGYGSMTRTTIVTEPVMMQVARSMTLVIEGDGRFKWTIVTRRAENADCTITTTQVKQGNVAQGDGKLTFAVAGGTESFASSCGRRGSSQIARSTERYDMQVSGARFVLSSGPSCWTFNRG